MKVKDMAVQDDAELEALLNMETSEASKEFCSNWEKWKPTAKVAVGVLSVLYPPGAKVILLLMSIADSYCPKA